MDQRRPTPTRPRWLATAQTALLADPLLAGQAAGTFVGLACAGFVAGLALALVAGRERVGAVWGVVVLVGLLLGLALVALLVGDRRHLQRLRRGQRRYFVGLVALCLGTSAAIVALAVWPLWVAGGLATLAALAIPLAARWGRRTGQVLARRLAHDRRAAWLAQVRASRLTRRMIGYAAYKQLRRDGFLSLKSTVHPNRTYQIPLRTTPSGARILVLDGDRPIGGLCLRPREPLPDPEEALTHILAIRTDERAWLDRANFFPQDRELTPQALGLVAGRPGNYER